MTTVNINEQEGFPQYPNHRVCAIFENSADANAGVQALIDLKLKEENIDVLKGGIGADIVDAEGTEHGLLTQLSRTLFAWGDAENDAYKGYEQALQEGMYVVTVHADSDEEKEAIVSAFASHNGHDINFFGTWVVEGH